MLRGKKHHISRTTIDLLYFREEESFFLFTHKQSWGNNWRETKRDTHESEKKNGQLGKEIGQREGEQENNPPINHNE